MADHETAELECARNISQPISSPPKKPELFSNGRGHTHVRTEDPPRDPATNQMICKYSQCCRFRFDRRCEWCKHMDKHDRPYVCEVEGCEVLQGFTYAGGLLRHQREVHRHHGCGNVILFCPESSCKRSNGTAFTRKENLKEHIRRVHRKAPGRSVSDSATAKEEESATLNAGIVPIKDQNASIHAGKKHMLKRKRDGDCIREGEEEKNDLSEEVKRLKDGYENNKRRISNLEALLAQLSG